MQPRSARWVTVLVAAMVTVSAACGGSAANGAGPQGSSATPGTTNAPAGTTTTSAPAPATPSPGCGKSTVAAVDAEKHTMTVDGAERYYLLTTPAAHDGHTPLPLVFDFHG